MTHHSGAKTSRRRIPNSKPKTFTRRCLDRYIACAVRRSDTAAAFRKALLLQDNTQLHAIETSRTLRRDEESLIHDFWIATIWLGVQRCLELNIEDLLAHYKVHVPPAPSNPFRRNIKVISQIVESWGSAFWHDLRDLGLRLPLHPAKNFVEQLRKASAKCPELLVFAFHLRVRFLGHAYFLEQVEPHYQGPLKQAQVEAGTYEIKTTPLADFLNAVTSGRCPQPTLAEAEEWKRTRVEEPQSSDEEELTEVGDSDDSDSDSQEYEPRPSKRLRRATPERPRTRHPSLPLHTPNSAARPCLQLSSPPLTPTPAPALNDNIEFDFDDPWQPLDLSPPEDNHNTQGRMPNTRRSGTSGNGNRVDSSRDSSTSGTSPNHTAKGVAQHLEALKNGEWSPVVHALHAALRRDDTLGTELTAAKTEVERCRESCKETRRQARDELKFMTSVTTDILRAQLEAGRARKDELKNLVEAQAEVQSLLQARGINPGSVDKYHLAGTAQVTADFDESVEWVERLERHHGKIEEANTRVNTAQKQVTLLSAQVEQSFANQRNFSILMELVNDKAREKFTQASL